MTTGDGDDRSELPDTAARADMLGPPERVDYARESVRRQVVTSSGIELARRVRDLGESDVSEDSDGRIWATGPDRREQPRG